jgi:hypothetical protein
VGDKWRDIYVVAGAGLDAVLDVVVQEHKDRVTGHQIDRSLGLTVMVVLGARPWRHVGFAHPDVLRAGQIRRDSH